MKECEKEVMPFPVYVVEREIAIGIGIAIGIET